MGTKFSNHTLQTKLTIIMTSITTVIILIILAIFLIRDVTNTSSLLDARFETTNSKTHQLVYTVPVYLRFEKFPFIV